MPHIRQLTIVQQVNRLSSLANLQSRQPRFNAPQYMVLYSLAKEFTSEPKTLVLVLRQLPEATDCADSIILARKNHDRDQSRKMLRRLRVIIKEVLSTLKLSPP